VKIDGVLHEFSPIPGVVEDATDIILNLKQIPLKLHVDHTKTLTLRLDKPGETATSRFWSRMPTSRPSPRVESSTWRCA
jgi:DNA-directed RNA polymerase alpha subunit